MRGLACAASAALLLCSVTLCGVSAGAAPFPSVNGPPGATPATAFNPTKSAYQQTELGNCTAPGTCQIAFPATTAASTLIRHVSCGFVLTADGSAFEAYLSGDGGNNVSFLPVSQYTPAANGNTVNLIDAQTYYFLSVGKKPLIDIVTTGAGAQSLQCTLAGNTG
ncbi:MAG: hypothetical protein WBQ17_14835 [Rhizomicrobium sp.]